jgi:hypothetical protein
MRIIYDALSEKVKRTLTFPHMFASPSEASIRFDKELAFPKNNCFSPYHRTSNISYSRMRLEETASCR